MRTNTPKLGTFVKYILNPIDTVGPYALIFKLFNDSSSDTDCQVVWFGRNKKKIKFDISGAVYGHDCKRVYKVPKYVTNNVEQALQYVKKTFESYRDPEEAFDNLDCIEILSRVRKLI